MRYDVIISDAALSMLDSHIDFLARVSPSAATRLADDLMDAIESLSENPQRYPGYENQFILDARYRKMVFDKRYVILYEVTDTTVFVDYIIDGRQDYEWMIR